MSYLKTAQLVWTLITCPGIPKYQFQMGSNPNSQFQMGSNPKFPFQMGSYPISQFHVWSFWLCFLKSQFHCCFIKIPNSTGAKSKIPISNDWNPKLPCTPLLMLDFLFNRCRVAFYTDSSGEWVYIERNILPEDCATGLDSDNLVLESQNPNLKWGQIPIPNLKWG